MLSQLVRHATLHLDLPTARILVDPMLSAVGAMDPVLNAANANHIPLVELPLSDAELASLFKTTNGVLVTHVHRDHWDKRAAELLPEEMRVLFQSGDEETFRQAGFQYVTPIATAHEWRGIRFYRIDG